MYLSYKTYFKIDRSKVIVNISYENVLERFVYWHYCQKGGLIKSKEFTILELCQSIAFILIKLM